MKDEVLKFSIASGGATPTELISATALCKGSIHITPASKKIDFLNKEVIGLIIV
jgi:hypothetical protein